MSLFHKKGEYKESDGVWVPDHKHKQCMGCQKPFTLVNRKHHCRKCGNLVCNHCSTNKWWIEKTQQTDRVCDTCFYQLSNLHPVITHPHYQVLTSANFFSWLATFEKSWIRSRYPKKYNKYKKQLLLPHTENTKFCAPIKQNRAKTGLQNIKRALTPKALQKGQKAEDKKQRNGKRKNNDPPKGSYERPKKQKYQQQEQKQKRKLATATQENINISRSKSKKRKYNPLVVVQTGVLYVNIMEAQGLPDCDRFSQPDGYCVYYVTNNDPCFGETTKYSTKVQHNTV